MMLIHDWQDSNHPLLRSRRGELRPKSRHAIQLIRVWTLAPMLFGGGPIDRRVGDPHRESVGQTEKTRAELAINDDRDGVWSRTRVHGVGVLRSRIDDSGSGILDQGFWIKDQGFDPTALRLQPSGNRDLLVRIEIERVAAV